MTNDQKNPLAQSIDFGLQVEAFLASEIGLYLCKRADEEIEDAIEDLKTADPECPKEIRELQNKIYRAEAIQYWLAEAIQAGINSEAELNEGD